MWLSYPPLSTKILFSTFILGRKGVFNPKTEIICSGFSFHSSEPRWEKGLNFVNPCYPQTQEKVGIKDRDRDGTSGLEEKQVFGSQR